MRSPRSAMLKLQLLLKYRTPCFFAVNITPKILRLYIITYTVLRVLVHRSHLSFSLVLAAKIWFRLFGKKILKLYFHANFETYTHDLLLVHWATVLTRIKDPLTNKLVLIHAYYCEKCSNKKIFNKKCVIKFSIIIKMSGPKMQGCLFSRFVWKWSE